MDQPADNTGQQGVLIVAEPQYGWVCPKCRTDRLTQPCPKGHTAALTGECPMVAKAHAAPKESSNG